MHEKPCNGMHSTFLIYFAVEDIFHILSLLHIGAFQSELALLVEEASITFKQMTFVVIGTLKVKN